MNPDYSLPFSLLYGTGVYGWRRGDRYLYIGQTKVFAYRLQTHHVIGKVLDFEMSDQLDIWFCDECDLDTLESTLIRLHKPLYNGQWLNSPTVSPEQSKLKAIRKRIRLRLKRRAIRG